MSRRRSPQEIELNFDGLTDSVTNLVGALILLIVLVFGVTNDVRNRATNSPPLTPLTDGGAASRQSGPKPVQALLREVEVLRQNIAAADQQIQELETTMDKLRQKQRDLLQRAGPPAKRQNRRT